MNDEVFVATSEWREIRDGQKVPSGLHYRINLETGKKEAKTLSEEDVQTKGKNRRKVLPA
jgi:nucleotide exchange factor SIL1